MVVALCVAAAAMTSAPILAVVAVSVASRREDRAWTLAGPPPGPAQAVARNLVYFYARGIDWLREPPS
jgi:hypothetical protein